MPFKNVPNDRYNPFSFGASAEITPFHALQRSGPSSSIAVSNFHIVKRGSKN
jgi:hypothetical protein